MGDLLLNIALVLVFVLIGGVFAATEMALVTLRESQINAIGQRGKRGAKVAGLARNPNTFLSAVQIGVTVAGFASAAYGATSIAPSLAPLFESWGLAPAVALTVATLVLTLVIAYLSLVLGELVPKRLAIQRNAQFAYAVAPALNGFATVMRPVIWLLSVSTNALVRLLGGDPHKTSDELTDEEVRDIVATHQGLPDDERRILDDVLSLRGRQVSEVMRPRPEVVALDQAATVGAAMQQVRELPFSRYPVSDTSIDDITGFVHVRDLFEAAADDPERPLAALVRQIPYIPSTARVLPTLTRMRAEGHHIAVVVDEYGGTDGLVTLEDLVEEVVGEIFDEYDAEVFISADDGLDGRLNLQDFEEATGLAMPRGSSDTIAGFVTEQLGRLAVVGDTVEVPGATIQVAEVDRRRIARVRVTLHAEPEPAAEH
ncbi:MULTISPECIES: hemolysin family protein [Microbacterium]|uniref:Hemolysin family protein n=2 Tax=Microbacterium TaxID=33882 RepID=A0ABY4IEG2_9MICO|nr:MULTISPECIES: hemolysin family protein [Microbacterium]MBN6190797.1 HlyC/CorC family transporter [Aneurinibacillus sp. BA2021]MCK2026349.1 hemolysin family protein [Microbacterium sufflavum]MPS76282.1 HlyC/CorC family transporter [Microbacterium sp.]UPL11149.1 hemolysin family protein [Microbacterium sufflavum]